MSEGAAARKQERALQLKKGIHDILQQGRGEKQPVFYRMEWFHDHQSAIPSGSVGYVKFVLIVGLNPTGNEYFFVQMGYAIVKPARVPEARGAYQDYGFVNGYTRKVFDDSMRHAMGTIMQTQIRVEDIEQALKNSLALKRQPYKQGEYESILNPLERALSELYQDGISCTASNQFSNPLHPHLRYRLVAQRQNTGVDLHCVGVPRETRGMRHIEDIRTHKGTIGEVVEKFHDSLARSYISPEELRRAITRFQPRSANYL